MSASEDQVGNSGLIVMGGATEPLTPGVTLGLRSGQETRDTTDSTRCAEFGNML